MSIKAGGITMTVGQRIKKIRKFRGKTLKEVGVALGNPEKTADVRVAQYESGKRNPTDETIELLAKILKVNPHAIGPHEHETMIGLMHTLFDLEECYGLHIDQIDGELVLRMDKSHKEYVNLFDSMLEWYEEWKRDQVSDDPVAYAEWKFTYPHPIGKKKK